MADPDTPKSTRKPTAGPQGRESEPHEAAHPKDHDGTPLSRPPPHYKAAHPAPGKQADDEVAIEDLENGPMS